MMSALLLQLALLINFSSGLLLDNEGEQRGAAKVLVFGDSWGAMGPGYGMLADMFKRHGFAAKVKSTAVSGTRACQWAENPDSMRTAAQQTFGVAGPDYVWYTLGGNDLFEPNYLACAQKAKSKEQAAECAFTQAAITVKCNANLLDNFFLQYPRAQVLQCAYDFQCSEGMCLPMLRWPFCAYDALCANQVGAEWQHRFLNLSMAHFSNQPNYNTIDINGVMQEAGKVPNAAMGNPVLGKGAPCELMLMCVHPKPNSAGSFLIGERFWEHFFEPRVLTSKVAKVATVNLSSATGLMPSTVQIQAADTMQTDDEVLDIYCKWNWVPYRSPVPNCKGSATRPTLRNLLSR